MIAKKNIERIKEKTNECVAKSIPVNDWLNTGEGDGKTITDELWQALGFDHDGTIKPSGLNWLLDLRDVEGYEAGVKLIYEECCGHSLLPEWVRDGMRANYTNMLATVYGTDKTAIDADINAIKVGYEALDMCVRIGGMARRKLLNEE